MMSLRSLTVTQPVERAKIFFGQPYPSLSIDGRPQIACGAPTQTLTMIINLDQRLMALLAAFGFVLGHQVTAYHKVETRRSVGVANEKGMRKGADR